LEEKGSCFFLSGEKNFSSLNTLDQIDDSHFWRFPLSDRTYISSDPFLATIYGLVVHFSYALHNWPTVLVPEGIISAATVAFIWREKCLQSKISVQLVLQLLLSTSKHQTGRSMSRTRSGQQYNMQCSHLKGRV